MSIKLPQKPRAGFHSINELTRAVNGIIDYISSFSLTAKKPVKVNHTMFGTEIYLEDSNGDLPRSTDYLGFFKVVVENDSVSVINGAYPDDTYAGYAFYNAAAVHCPVGSIPAESGFLCLKINYDSSYHVSYGFSDDVSDMPHLEDAGGDNTAEYPLALISEGEDGWEIQQLCYGIPQLWCFGPCDTDSEEENPSGGIDYGQVEE